MNKKYSGTWFRDCVQIIILFILLYILCSFTMTNSNKIDNIITWRKLSYKDFTIIQDLGGIKVAESNTGISYELIKDGKSIATAIFEKDKSYISAKLVPSKIDYIISHEQIHFDITELITRRLNLKFKDIKDIQVADKLFNQSLNELETMQVLYDYETNHSENHETQNKWILQIKELLKKSNKQNSN